MRRLITGLCRRLGALRCAHNNNMATCCNFRRKPRFSACFRGTGDSAVSASWVSRSPIVRARHNAIVDQSVIQSRSTLRPRAQPLTFLLTSACSLNCSQPFGCSYCDLCACKQPRLPPAKRLLNGSFFSECVYNYRARRTSQHAYVLIFFVRCRKTQTANTNSDDITVRPYPLLLITSCCSTGSNRSHRGYHLYYCLLRRSSTTYKQNVKHRHKILS